jgi:thiamine biosynthesis lipoprotein
MSVASASFAALGTTATVFVDDSGTVSIARDLLTRELEEIDAACSRFRADSGLSRLNRSTGAPVVVDALLLAAVEAALRVARQTDGYVDPTIGRALRALGYDRDFELVRDGPPPTVTLVAAPGWRAVKLDRGASTITVPSGVELDLGATGKAFAADRAAASIHDATGGGVLVNLGGDLATAGPAPAGGWRVRIADDHTSPEPDAETVAVASGAIATSSVTARRWGSGLHHIVDPRTGAPAKVVWRTATVAAASCVDANAAATAAIVRGRSAIEWLESLALPSRLVSADGDVVPVAGWPERQR